MIANDGPAPTAARILTRLVGAAFAVVVVLAISAPAFAQVSGGHPGISVYKRAGCITCHKWHGMGGPGYGGTPINFREMFLDRDQLIEVIACGRPGTGMPYFVKKAYDGHDCYDGMTMEDMDEEDRPGASRTTLSNRQVNQVSDFILEHFKGRTNELVRGDCEIFFGESRVCRKLEVQTRGGGGGGH